MGLALLFAAGCLGWPKSEIKVVGIPKVPAIGPPVWRVDLQAFGYADRVEARWASPSGATVASCVHGGLVFVDQHTLLVAFVREVPGQLARRHRLQETSPLRLQGVFFRTDTGEVVAQRDWGTSNQESNVITGYDGKFVLKLGEKFVLYSSALAPLKELELPPSPLPSLAGSLSADGGIRRSPSGRTILLMRRQQRQRYHYLVLDSETLSPRESWSAPGMQIPAVADDKVALLSGVLKLQLSIQGLLPLTQFTNLGSVAVRPQGGALTNACEDGQCGRPSFVNNQVLALDTQEGLRFIHADGKPLSPKFKIRGFGPRTLVNPLESASYYGCARGDRLAVPLFWQATNVLGVDAGPGLFNLYRILVFDLPSGQWIGALEASQYKIKSICDAALSPDGSSLAVFREEGIVEVYPLPASPSPPQTK